MSRDMWWLNSTMPSACPPLADLLSSPYRAAADESAKADSRANGASGALNGRSAVD